MKIFLDDVRDTPKGWGRCYWPEEVIALLQAHYEFRGDKVEAISLDHDLGDDKRGTGMTVLNWIEEQVFTKKDFIPPILTVHSDNAPRRMEMTKVIERIVKEAYAQSVEREYIRSKELRAYLTIFMSVLALGVWLTSFYFGFINNEIDILWPFQVIITITGIIMFPWLYFDLKYCFSILQSKEIENEPQSD